MALAPDLCIQSLASIHDRLAFRCGQEVLDRYLHEQAGQDVRRKANAVFVMTDISVPERVVGFYTLCATALAPGDVPDAARRHLLHYPLVSATLIGRLAISLDHRRRGLGSVLLLDAVERAFMSAATVGSSMIVVDALDSTAAAFYAAHGFIPLPESMRLILPMRSVAAMIDGA